MGDCSDGEFWSAIREIKKDQKIKRFEEAITVLNDLKIPYEKMNEYHLKLHGFDYWPSTGLFINVKTKKRGHGISSLLKKIASSCK